MKQIENMTNKELRYGFLLLPNFSLIAFSSAIEPLRMANWISEQSCYSTTLISHDGKPVISSSGVPIQVDHSLKDLPYLDAVFVCGASPIARTGNEAVIDWLKRQSTSSMKIGGIGTGSYILAVAGLLDNYRATIHWWHIENLKQEFPKTQVSNRLFEIDGPRYTCSGGTASMDMMLFLIGVRQNMDLAAAISEQFVCERIRGTDDQQRIPIKSRISANQPKLIEAVTLMEANIEEPLSTDDLAHHVKLSRRHLERLFKKYLHNVPAKYYIELRLTHARKLLRQSDKTILQIGLCCGFSSASYFSTAYKNFYHINPREERKQVEING
ncbi:MAG: transcriptional regulator GlxA family with amidase domain [Oceanospirillaceae bacterium]|jgi:transcriptional regulator GlxA family with amidase domain